MMKNVRGRVKALLNALMAPAEDPRLTHTYSHQDDSLLKTLKRGFSNNNLDEGLRTLNQLIYEYEQLKPVLSRR